MNRGGYRLHRIEDRWPLAVRIAAVAVLSVAAWAGIAAFALWALPEVVR